MEIKSVLLESETIDNSKVYGSSALMLNDTYILTASNLNLPLYKNKFNSFLNRLKPNELNTDDELLMKKSSIFRVIYKSSNGSGFVVKNAELLAIYQSKNIKNLSSSTLKDWSIDTIDNKKDLEEVLSLFFIYKVENHGNLEDLKNCLKLWWDSIKNQTIQQTDEIYIKSTPFGNRNFLETINRGIVSNLIGPNSCLILSDCPATPGAEGSPVYKTDSNNHYPIGVVISSLCWWKGDWTGLTFIADVRTILLEIIGNPLYMNETTLSPHPNLISACESSFVQVYSGSHWGTAIVLDIDKGLLITNSHVIVDTTNIRFFHKSQDFSIPMNLIYKNPDDRIFDLALLYCHPNKLKQFNLNSINRTITGGKDLKLGDEVYCVGFSLFTKNVQINPTISKGYICQINDGMIKTSCCINPGMSGGAILDSNGSLIGIIVSNIKLKGSNVFPRFNLIIPYYAIGEIIDKYISTGRFSVLNALECQDPKSIRVWNGLTSHL